MTPPGEGIVPCRPASHAGRERVRGSCGERGQKLAVAGLINQARRLCLSFFRNPRIYHSISAGNVPALSGRTGDHRQEPGRERTAPATTRRTTARAERWTLP